MSKKLKKTYLLTVCVSIIYFTLIVCIINNCRQVTQEYVDEYKLHIEKIGNLEDNPLTLAKEFMQTDYDKRWDSLKGCWSKTDLIGGYELYSYIISGRYATSFYRDWKNDYDKYNQDSDNLADMRILCNAYANDESEYDTRQVRIAFDYSNKINDIAVYVQYHENNLSESVIFINLVEDKYVADKTNLEELTGLTIEEIVETAELNRKGFEDLMYTMKEHELEESKNDLNSDMKSSYTIAALQIVALLSLWITVLVAIFKSMTKKKIVSTPIDVRQRDKTLR